MSARPPNPIIGTIDEVRIECNFQDPHREQWPVCLEDLNDQPKACLLAAPELLAQLQKNLDAWDDEEDSVIDEHREMIEETRKMITKHVGVVKL